jgi:tetratricopeptide (TPR) repeat protein
MIELRNDNALSAAATVQARCQLAADSVSAGDYTRAREIMSDFWCGIGARPNVARLAPIDAAEVLFQVGTLTSLIGEHQQLAFAQDRARDLLRESKAIFESVGSNRSLWVESEIGATFIKTKQYNTAISVLRPLFREVSPEPSHLLALVVYRLAGAELGDRNVDAALELLEGASLTVEIVAPAQLRGKYHQLLAHTLTQQADVTRDEATTDRALLEYEAASFFYEQCGNRQHLAVAEANRGELFLKLGVYSKASELLKRARRLFVENECPAYVAEVDAILARLDQAQMKSVPKAAPEGGSGRKNVIPFRPIRMAAKFHILTVPDDGLIDADIRIGDRLSLRRTPDFMNGDVVLVSTPDGELLAHGYHEPDGGICLKWAYGIFPDRAYHPGEYTILGVL